MSLNERLDKLFVLLSDLYKAMGTLAAAEKLDSESTLMVIDSMTNIASDMTDICSVVTSIDYRLATINTHLAKLCRALDLIAVVFFCWFAFIFVRWISHVH